MKKLFASVIIVAGFVGVGTSAHAACTINAARPWEEPKCSTTYVYKDARKTDAKFQRCLSRHQNDGPSRSAVTAFCRREAGI